MARSFLTPIDLNKLELLQPRAQQLASDPSSPVSGQFYYNSADGTLRFYNGSVFIPLGRLNQLAAPTGAVSLNSQQITNLADPSSAQDAATKAYADNIAGGLSWKDSVRAATTASSTLASTFENGDTIDGVVLATGDRILIKNQTTASENGIYTVNASGAPTRATDADSSADIRSAAVWVEQGTTNADSAWVCTTDAPITLGSTSLTFAQFGAGGTAYTGGTGIQVSGNVISINPIPIIVANGGTGQTTLTNNAVLTGAGTSGITSVGPGATGTVLKGTGGAPSFGQVALASDVSGTLPVANGGTGGTSTATAKTALGFMSRYAADYGDGAATSYNIDHNLNTLDVIVQVFRKSDGVEVEVDVTRSTVNRVIVAHAVAPASNAFRVVVMG